MSKGLRPGKRMRRCMTRRRTRRHYRGKKVVQMTETSQVMKVAMEVMKTSSVEDLTDVGHMDAVSITEGIDAVPTIGSNSNHKMRRHNHKSNNIILIIITSILR